VSPRLEVGDDRETPVALAQAEVVADGVTERAGADHRCRGFVRDLRPHLFVSADRTPPGRKYMFASSDRTLLAADYESLTSADTVPLVGAKEPRPQTAVTSRKHLSPSGPLNAVETGKQPRSVLTNAAMPP
jgi:hypothetical protein